MINENSMIRLSFLKGMAGWPVILKGNGWRGTHVGLKRLMTSAIHKQDLKMFWGFYQKFRKFFHSGTTIVEKVTSLDLSRSKLLLHIDTININHIMSLFTLKALA